MKSNKEAKKNLSRRDFFKTTAAGVGMTALAGIGSKGVAAAQVPTGMTTEEENVLDANKNFYSALQDLSLEEMDAVWLQEDWVRCVHPGRNLLEGWEAVRESWRHIFENTNFMSIAVGVQFIRVESSTAWICCTEKISSAAGSRINSAYEQATNIFERRHGEWYVVHHHASPLPTPWPETA